MTLRLAQTNNFGDTMDNIDNMNLDKMAQDVQKRQGEVEDREDEMYGNAVKGKFSSKGLNSLVQATNRLLPLFGIKDAYPTFSGSATSLPPDFVRILTMFSKAISDAISGGLLPEDSAIDLSIVTDDSGLQSLGGRIGMASKSPSFKRFLMKKTESAESPTEDTSYERGMRPGSEAHKAEEMSEEGTDKLFKSRM